MATITLKDVPRVLHLEIKKRAEVNRRSINNEIITTLERLYGIKEINPDDLILKANQIKGQIKGFLTQRVLESFKNEGRK